MDHVIGYAKDENKTKIEFNQKYEILVDDLQNVIDYARNSDKTEKELYQIVWEKIKELNKSFPRYKHIQKLILTSEELIKTTTQKIKRHEEMKKIKISK